MVADGIGDIRPYRFENERVFTAVIGEISLDARWRGRGLGQVLLRFMTQHLDQHFPRAPALVIPTSRLPAARWRAPAG